MILFDDSQRTRLAFDTSSLNLLFAFECVSFPVSFPQYLFSFFKDCQISLPVVRDRKFPLTMEVGHYGSRIGGRS